MSGGTFNVSRKIWDHPEFRPEPFSEREAFLWLVSEASWKSRTVRAGRVVVDVERGQLCASIRFMAEAWQWSKSRVNRFLKRLENRDMIETQIGTGQLVLTVCNYDTFQGKRDVGGTRAGRKAGHERDSGGTNEKKDAIQSKKEYTTNPPEGVTDRFDEFWQEVPRKIGKGTAKRAFAKAVKKVDPQIIIDAMRAHAKAMKGKDQQYIPHPSTWLNGERWDDEAPAPTDSGCEARRKAAEAWL